VLSPVPAVSCRLSNSDFDLAAEHTYCVRNETCFPAGNFLQTMAVFGTIIGGVSRQIPLPCQVRRSSAMKEPERLCSMCARACRIRRYIYDGTIEF
jgi:hypothetical protein